MRSISKNLLKLATSVALLSIAFVGCKAGGNDATGAAGQPPFMSTMAAAVPRAADDALPASQTGGFDGKRAYDLVAKQVSFGPRPSGSPAIAKLQDFLQSELKSYGCTVDTDNFSADTPIGRVSMENLVAKTPGEKPGIIILATHYDTARTARDPQTGQVHPMP